MDKVKVTAIQSFEFENKKWFVGDTDYVIERAAKRWVSRGIAKYADPNYIPNRVNKKHPKVSIIILIKDALEYVEKCIKSLNDYTNYFELILIDNGSNQKTKDWLKKLDWLDYTLIENKENKGFSYGCNQGIKVAKYDYLCFLNSDTLLTPDWLPKLMRGFKYHKNVGIVGPSTCHSSTMQTLQTLRGKHTITDQKKINEMSANLREAYIETMVVGFCFIIKRAVFDKIGVFDHKRYGIATHEDIDLVWRASKVGFKSVWVMASYVHHFGNKSTKEMGIDPKALRVKIAPRLKERMKDPELYVENDAGVENVKRIKGTIPILMITWNRLEYTKKAVGAILKNTDHPYRLSIWDNASTDGTKEYLRSLGNKNIQVTYETENQGIVVPMNRFIEMYQNHRYITKVDNDTVVPKGWLSKLKEVMDEYPFRAVEADHYLMLNHDIKKNDDFYKHLYGINFKGNKLYLLDWVGGTGTIIRTAKVKDIPEMKGTLLGWVKYQANNPDVSAFYTGVFVKRLDQTGTNKYKEPSDYPEYDEKISTLYADRKDGKETKKKKPIPSGAFQGTYRKMKDWYERL